MCSSMLYGRHLLVYTDLDNAGDISSDEKHVFQDGLQHGKIKASKTESLFRRILIDIFESETLSLLKLLDPFGLNITKLQPYMVGSISEGFGLVENIQFGEDSDESVSRDEVDFNLAWKSLKICDPGYFNSTKPNNSRPDASNFDAQVEFSVEFPGHAAIKLTSNDAVTRCMALSNILINNDGSKLEVYLHPEAVSDEFFMQLRVQSILCTLLANLRMFINNDTDHDGRKAFLEKCGYSIKDDTEMVECQPSSESSTSASNIEKLIEEKIVIDENKNVDDLENFLTPQLLFILDQAGPAVSINVFDKRLKGGSFAFDMAPSLPIYNWPSIANEWISRHRPSSWPSQGLISSILQEGCSLVPVCPVKSQTGLEWRLSFSSSERMLAQSLTEPQKICYLIVKGIWRHFLRHPKKKGLQSYHIKITMFWVCEEVSLNDWKRDNTARGVLRILHKLYSFLVNMCCPHYFIPSNNIFQDIEGGVLLDTLQRVTIAIVSRQHIWYDNPGLLTMLPPEHSRLHFYDLEDKAFREGIGNIFRFCFDLVSQTDEESSKDASLFKKMIYNIKDTLGKCCKSQESSIYFLAGFFVVFGDTIGQQYQISACDMRRFLGSRMSPRMIALKDPIPLDIIINLSAGLEMFKLAFKLFSVHIIHNEDIEGNLQRDDGMNGVGSGWDRGEGESELYSDEMVTDLLQTYLKSDSDSDNHEDNAIEIDH